MRVPFFNPLPSLIFRFFNHRRPPFIYSIPFPSLPSILPLFLFLFLLCGKKKSLFLNRDAASLVRTIFKAVKYIHDSGIVHRGIVVFFLFIFAVCEFTFLGLDLKPENLLFRTPEEDADIMLADFGLSRIMEEEKLNMLTEICGTPGVSFKFRCCFFQKKKNWHCSFVC